MPDLSEITENDARQALAVLRTYIAAQPADPPGLAWSVSVLTAVIGHWLNAQATLDAILGAAPTEEVS